MWRRSPAIAAAALMSIVAAAAPAAPRADAGQFNVMLCAAGNNAQNFGEETNNGSLFSFGTNCGSTSGEPAGESGYLRLQTSGASGEASAGAVARFYWNAPSYLYFKQAGGYTRQPDLSGDGWPDITSRWRVRFDLNNQATITLNQGVASGTSSVNAEPQKTFGPHLWPFGYQIAFSQFSYRLICPSGGCPKGGPRTTSDANTFKFIVGDDYGPGAGISTQTTMTQGGWVRGTQPVYFYSSDAGSGIRANRLYVDNALIGQANIGCSTFVANGVEYGYTFVPCSGGPIGSTINVNTAGNNPSTGQPFGDGLHTVSFCGVDYGGNVGCSSFTGHFDNNAPTGPTNLSASGSFSKFSATWTNPNQTPGSPIAAVHYRLTQLSGGSFDSGSQVVSGQEITSLSGRPAGGDGEYRLTVWLEDSAANVNSSNTAVQTFEVDSSAPDTSIDSGPAAGSYSNQSTADFTYSSSKPEGTFQCKLDSGAFASCPTTGQSYSSLADGAHTFEVRAVDPSTGTDPSPASRSWTVDRTAPVVSFSPPSPVMWSTTGPAVTFEFAASDASPVAYTCALDGGTAVPCTAPQSFNELSDGWHYFIVRATDAAGNASGQALRYWMVDGTAPETTVTAGPASGSTINTPTPTFAFEASETESTFGCALDSEKFASCASPYTLGALGDGPHVFQVRATDAVGNVGEPVLVSFTVDATPPPPPTLSSTSPASPANDNSPKVEGSAEAGSTVALYTAADCSGSTAATANASGLAAGLTVSVPDDSTTTFYATATDGAGNTSGCSSGLAYVEDSTPPPARIESGPTGATSDPRPPFTFSSTDSSATFSCSVDQGAASFGPCTTGSSFRPSTVLADGAWTFRAKATDAAGNSTTVTRNFRVDTTPPAPPGFSHVPSDPSQDTSPHFEITGELGGSFECSLDGAPYAHCDPSYDPGKLAYGKHALSVRERDSVGNVSAATVFSWHVVLFTDLNDPHHCALKKFKGKVTRRGLRVAIVSEVPRLVKIQIFRKRGRLVPKRRLLVFRKRSETKRTIRLVRRANFRSSRKVRNYARASLGRVVTVRVVPRVINEVRACNVGGPLGDQVEKGYMKRFTRKVRLKSALLRSP
jgi:Bacterial Ig-like domain